MILRKQFKRWLYGTCPGFAGAFPYYGVKVHFPRGSSSFLAACQQGVFESENVRILQALIRPNTMFFDIGANIGLMSVPVLAVQPNARAVSFEASPNVLPFLRRTIADSTHCERWSLVAKAVGANPGKVTFSLSDPKNSLFDGIRPTQRVHCIACTEVEMTSVDATWAELGYPSVSLLKCDVEGGELDVLLGARECLRRTRPAVLVEWNPMNLAVYDVQPRAILDFAEEHKFSLHAVPTLVRIISDRQLSAHCAFTENFLLLPRP